MEGRAGANGLLFTSVQMVQTIGLIQILSVRDRIVYRNYLFGLPPNKCVMSHFRIGFHTLYINKMLIRMYPDCWTVAKMGDPLKYPNGVSAGHLSELG